MEFVLGYMLTGPMVYFGVAIAWICIILVSAIKGELDVDKFASISEYYKECTDFNNRYRTKMQIACICITNFCIIWPVKAYELNESLKSAYHESKF